MLLPLLTFIAVLIGGISFASIIEAWNRDLRESAPPPVFLNRQVSLWSLVLFLFFPWCSLTSDCSANNPAARGAAGVGQLGKTCRSASRS